MAGASSGVWRVQLKGVNVPKDIVEGEKFVKWDEDTAMGGSAVTLKVDPNGFYIYWINQNKEVDLLDIATIRDTRCGKGAKIPKDPKLKQVVTWGSQDDTLEEKTLTLVYGPNFVNLNYLNFCCSKKETAKLWADELLAIATNPLQLNSPIMSVLIKLHTKLTLLTDKQGQIPIRNIVRTFAKDKEDRKKVEKALEASGLPSGKVDYVAQIKFTFEDFFTFYKHLTVRPEIERVFGDFSGFNKKKIMSAEQFMDFINKKQRDPRLNEILYPYTTPMRAKELIEQYEPNVANSKKGLLSLDGFLRYMLSEDNAIVSMTKYDLSDDMDHPLNHYFINSSHNTYLIGHQITGKSSVEMYRQTLLSGCRCVELDFWNGRNEDPVILHGYTLVPDLPAKDVIEAIAESAFKTSEYPVVLSFENHCNQKQQAKIAKMVKEIFGPMLLEFPLDSYPIEPGTSLPAPSLLKRRIIIKNKKKHHHHHHHRKQKPQKKISKTSIIPENGEPPPVIRDDSKESEIEEQIINDEDSLSSEDDEDSTEPDTDPLTAAKDGDISPSDKGTAGKETEAGAELSALVNYVQPVHFYSFEHSKNRNKCYEMSSFDEKAAMTLLKEHPVDFVNYNKHQLSRVYPRGTRVDSGNFMPQLFWNAGCQLVALNYQTLDLAMQLNLGIFELNKRCGYMLKPEFMRRKDRRFDPFAESTVDGIIAGHVCIQVISGQFLTEKRVGTYVEVDMFGLPADTVRKRFKTKIVPANGINPFYDEEPFIFKKVVLPELACIRFQVNEESGKMIGHRVLPVVGLRPGFRHVVLRNESGQPLTSTLFLKIKVKDYVPDGFSAFAEALANPIKYQSELEKRALQLSVLQDDLEDSSPEESLIGQVPSATQQSSNISNENNTTSTTQNAVQTSTKTNILTKGASIKKKLIGGEGSSSVVSSSSPPSIGHSMSSPAGSAGGGGPHSIVMSGKSESFDSYSKQSQVISSDSVGSTGSSAAAAASASGSTFLDAATALIQHEPLDKFLETKVYKEKRSELDRKLDALLKKHDKDRKTNKAPKKSHHKSLVKKLSSKNLGRENTIQKKDSAEISQSLIAEQLLIEKDAFTKGQDEIFAYLDKAIKAAHENQLKILSSLEEKDNREIMLQIKNLRKIENKKLEKSTRDKNEFNRMKRELDSKLVDRGVQERKIKKEIFEKFRTKVEKDHKDVNDSFTEWKNTVREQNEDLLKKRELELEEELNNSNLANTNPTHSS